MRSKPSFTNPPHSPPPPPPTTHNATPMTPTPRTYRSHNAHTLPQLMHIKIEYMDSTFCALFNSIVLVAKWYSIRLMNRHRCDIFSLIRIRRIVGSNPTEHTFFFCLSFHQTLITIPVPETILLFQSELATRSDDGFPNQGGYPKLKSAREKTDPFLWFFFWLFPARAKMI